MSDQSLENAGPSDQEQFNWCIPDVDFAPSDDGKMKIENASSDLLKAVLASESSVLPSGTSSLTCSFKKSSMSQQTQIDITDPEDNNNNNRSQQHFSPALSDIPPTLLHRPKTCKHEAHAQQEVQAEVVEKESPLRVFDFANNKQTWSVQETLVESRIQVWKSKLLPSLQVVAKLYNDRRWFRHDVSRLFSLNQNIATKSCTVNLLSHFYNTDTSECTLIAERGECDVFQLLRDYDPYQRYNNKYQKIQRIVDSNSLWESSSIYALVLFWWIQLTIPIKALHSIKQQHNDIKLSNFLVFVINGLIVLKMFDLGHASDPRLLGTVGFGAPEVLHPALVRQIIASGNQSVIVYGLYCDVYALAICFVKVWCEIYGIQFIDPLDAKFDFGWLHRGSSFFQNIAHYLKMPPFFCHLLHRMMMVDPTLRITTQQVLEMLLLWQKNPPEKEASFENVSPTSSSSSSTLYFVAQLNNNSSTRFNSSSSSLHSQTRNTTVVEPRGTATKMQSQVHVEWEEEVLLMRKVEKQQQAALFEQEERNKDSTAAATDSEDDYDCYQMTNGAHLGPSDITSTGLDDNEEEN